MLEDNHNRQEIIYHARRLFAEKGYAGTSMRDIAHSASINLSLIYYYFSNKEELFISILEDGFLALDQVIVSELDQTTDAISSIRQFIKIFVSHTLKNNCHARIVQQEMLLHNGTYFKTIAKKHPLSYLSRLEKILQKGMEDGLLKECDYRLIYFNLLGMMIYYVLAKPIVLDKMGKEDYDLNLIDQIVEHIMKLFFTGVIKN